jgi:hypothetical protein
VREALGSNGILMNCHSSNGVDLQDRKVLQKHIGCWKAQKW